MAEIVSLRGGSTIQVVPENIPDELKQKPRWFVWKWVNRGGKVTKPPFQPNGKAGNVRDPQTWSTFEVVLETVAKDEKYHGVGFVLTNDDDLIAWDLDHCIKKSGELESWAEEIVRKLDSYTEITPSGEGLRVFVRGELPEGKRKVGNIECYQDWRYITVTGNIYGDLKPIKENSLEVWEPIFGRKAKANSDKPEKQKRGKQTQLDMLQEGLWKEAGYPSQSEADLAYCRWLADEVRGNPEALDSEFRKSKLFREKWDVVHSGDGKTYGETTIALALAGWSSQFRLTDLGNAKRLANHIREDVRYCHGMWYIWDGKRFEEDKLQRIYLKTQLVIDELREEAMNTIDREQRAQIWKHMLNTESRNRIEGMIKLCESQPDIAVKVELLDADPFLFNTESGVINKDGMLRPCVAEDLITKLAPVRVRPNAKCPVWLEFLNRVLPDKEVQDFVQRAVGYSMTGDISEQVLFFSHGKGANGKSTFFSAIRKVLGDYASQLPVESLMATKNDQHPTVLADLRGVRFVLASEPEDGRRFNEGLLKQITGGEQIVARRMREDFFRFDSTAKLWIMGNHKPTIRGTDHAIWRRIRLIPFDVVIPKEEQDKDLWEKLEAELEGIFMWALEGMRKWLEIGLEPPSAVILATEEYRNEMDSIQEFLDEETETVAGAWCAHAGLYQRYVQRTTENNERLLSSKGFAAKLREKGLLDARRTANKLYWQGIQLRMGKGDSSQGEL